MARTETFEAKVYLNQKEAQNAMAELEAQIVDTGAALKKFNEEKNSKKSIEAEQHLKRLRKQYEEAKHGVENYRKALDNLNGQSLNELIRMQKALKRELDRTKPDTEEWKRMAKEYQQVTERIDSLKKAQKGIVTEGQKSTNAFKTLFGKVNEFYGGLLVYAKAAKAAFQAVIGVTKQVVNASQTMGDKWNNGMAAMKTTTEAFFFSLSTGDWTAFENGIASVLKKARQLAETMDLLGSYNIAEGYMQSKYLTDFQQNITTATDTEATEEERRKALDDAKADLEAYNEFIEGKAAATYKALQEEFDVYLGKTFESQAEFDQFFDKLFREATVGASEAVNEATAYMQEQYSRYASEYKVMGDQIVYTYTSTEARALATADAVRKYGQETVDLVRAANMNDEKHKALIETYSQYRNSVNLSEQREKQFNRTRDRVIKQLDKTTESTTKATKATDAYAEAIKKVDKAEKAQLITLKQLYASGIIDKTRYEEEKAVIEEDFLKQKMATAEKYGKDTDQFMSQLLDRQIARMDKAKAMLKEEMEEMMKVYATEHPDQNMSDEDYNKLLDNQRRQGYKEKLGTIPGETYEEFDARIEQYEAFQEKMSAKVRG